jgi:proteasome accessory factor A
MIDAGLITEEVVPDTKRILPIWTECLAKLAEGDIAWLSRRFDWALKLLILDREISRHGYVMEDPDVALLNLMYAHMDKEKGLYFALEREGYTETCVSEQHIRKMQKEGPQDTRAYARKAIIDKFPDDIKDIDWGEITVEADDGSWPKKRKKILLDDPRHYTRAEVGHIIESCRTVEELCEAFKAQDAYGAQTSSGTIQVAGS